MASEKKLTNINDCLAYLFNFDHLEITNINGYAIKMKAVISSGNTVINYYKIFQSYIREIEHSKDDPVSLDMFKKHLSKYKYDFDKRMNDNCKQIITMSKKFKVDIVLSYEGDFKKVYNKISEFVS